MMQRLVAPVVSVAIYPHHAFLSTAHLRILSSAPSLWPFVQSRSAITIKKSKISPAEGVTSSQTSAAARITGKNTAINKSNNGARAGPAQAEIASVRLAKRIAMAGICSRREAEKYIEALDVTVNGKLVTDVATVVDLERDVVAVNGRVLPSKSQAPKVWMAHKLPGELVTTNDPQGRATIFSRLRAMGLTHHMMPVGRLDYNTEGLILFTSDGDYARQLEHPKSQVQRVYRALVRGNVSESKLLELQRGPLVDGIKYRPIHVTVASTDKKDSWLEVKVAEGKNREVRKALAHVRLVVKRLIRVQYGPYRLADLPAGAVLEVKPKPIESKKRQEPKRQQSFAKKA